MRIITSQSFESDIFPSLLSRGKDDLQEVIPIVTEIIDAVREKGDTAVLNYTQKFDNANLTIKSIRVNEVEMKEAYKVLSLDQIKALKFAAKNIEHFHKKQLRKRWKTKITKGVTIDQIQKPLEKIGIYAPGGNAVYPSTILMCAIPAKIAGVKEIVVCSPVKEDGLLSPAILVAADIAGVDVLFKVGGAQAIAAMAYGTATIPKVNKIIGPGNKYVTTAKMIVNEEVAIDLPAGPSEILIIADTTANPQYLAADLLAQAEHDVDAWSILLITSEDLAEEVKIEIDNQIQTMVRKSEINQSLENRGLIVIVEDIAEAVRFSNTLAPEHLSIQTKNPQAIVEKIQNAGAIFLNRYTPVAFGDYTAGSNHVLPTAGFAKSFSGLTTADFFKSISIVQCTYQGFERLQAATITLAKMEGLEAHARSVERRRKN